MLAKPLSDLALLASLRARRREPPTRRAIVLVVDDDPSALKVMAASLGQLGYQAVCEPDPVRGLRAATEQPPAAIVLDLIMPGMTGFEFLDQLRTTPTAHAVPVIVWTSKDLTPTTNALGCANRRTRSSRKATRATRAWSPSSRRCCRRSAS